MMSAIKSGAVSHSRFAKMVEKDFKVSWGLAQGFVTLAYPCEMVMPAAGAYF